MAGDITGARLDSAYAKTQVQIPCIIMYVHVRVRNTYAHELHVPYKC